MKYKIVIQGENKEVEVLSAKVKTFIRNLRDEDPTRLISVTVDNENTIFPLDLDWGEIEAKVAFVGFLAIKSRQMAAGKRTGEINRAKGSSYFSTISKKRKNKKDEETKFLFKSPKNKKRLMKAVKDIAEEGC